jgi:hypothetical protein
MRIARWFTVLIVSTIGLAFSVSAQLAEEKVTLELVETYARGERKVVRSVYRDEAGEPVNHGPYRAFWKNGKVQAEGSYEHGLRTGEWTEKWERGKRKAEGSYAGGLRSGPWRFWHESGRLASEGDFQLDCRVGEWRFLNPDKSHDVRSGTYKMVHVTDEGGVTRILGQMLGRRRQGTWTWYRDDGSPLLLGTYHLGKRSAPWVLRHADGRDDPRWIEERRDVRGKRLGRVEDSFGVRFPGNGSHDAEWPARWPAPLAIAEMVARASEEDARAWIILRGVDAIPALLNRLSTLDLRKRSRLAEGELLHGILVEILGGTVHDQPWEWIRAPLIAARWHTWWEVLTSQDEETFTTLLAQEGGGPDRVFTIGLVDRVGLEPRLDAWLRPVVGEEVAEAEEATDPLPGVIGIGGGAGGLYGRRFAGRRTLGRAGGQGTTEPLHAALAWLAKAQRPDGSWAATSDKGDVAATGLALLALLGDGHTTTQGTHRAAVTLGIKSMRTRVDSETGGFHPAGAEPPEHVWQHAVATLAFAEAYYFSKSPLLGRTSSQLLLYLDAVRRSDGSWPREAAGSGDVATTAWVLRGLSTLEHAGVDVPATWIPEAREWLETYTNSRSGIAAVTGTSGYAAAGPDPTTALAAFARFASGTTFESDPSLTAAAKHVLERASATPLDPHLAFHGAHFLFQVGGGDWKTWNERVKPAVLEGQAKRGTNAGSWSRSETTASLGRVGETALRALTLEVYFRIGRFPH